MKIMPLGDYYVWYCEQCDTKNLTLWTRFEKGQVFCGACRRGFPMSLNAPPEREGILAGIV